MEQISKKLQRKILLNPGPATTSPSVKKALIVEDICPREKAFGKLTENVIRELVTVINGKQTDYTAILFGGSGSLVMESVITSLPGESDEILIISNGAYGKRFNEMAQRYQIKAHYLDLPWGQDIDLKQVEEKLKKPRIKYVYFTHLETTTGVLNNLRSINQLVHKHRKISVVDAMSSFGAIPIDAYKDEIDYIIASANKCLQGMAGVSYVIAKKKLIEALKDVPRRTYYSQLYEQHTYFLENYQFRFTPPVQIMYALLEALKQLKREGGVRKRYARYCKSYEFLKAQMSAIGFKLLKQGKESKILMTIKYPSSKKFDFDRLHDKLYGKGFTIYPGKLVDTRDVFRLSVLGDINHKDMAKFIVALKQVLLEMKVYFN